jgi:hypothetical protein
VARTTRKVSRSSLPVLAADETGKGAFLCQEAYVDALDFSRVAFHEVHRDYLLHTAITTH